MNNNLILSLVSLEASELKTVVRFAKSPFHNSNKLIIELLKELLLYYPHFNHKRLTKEIIFRKIHQEGTAYDNGKMSLLMTQLVKLIERFFMYQEFEKDELSKKKMQSKGFRKRGFYKEYKKEIDKTIHYLDSSSFHDEDYYFQKYFLNEELFFQIETDKLKEGQQYLHEAMENLDLFFMIAKTKLSGDYLTRSSTSDEQTSIKFFNQTLKYSNSEHNNNSLLLSIYHQAIQLKVNSFNNTDYENLKKLFFKEINKINLNDQRNILLNLINLNINQVNQGNQEVLKEVFKLYQTGFLKNLILKNGQITEYTYYNIASVGAVIKEYEWTIDFINRNEKYLPKSDAFQIKSYALATLYYVMGSKKDKKYFAKTMEILREATGSRKNNFVIINSKSLLIRSYYELITHNPSYEDPLDSLFTNFENQLRNNKTLSKNKIKGFLSFNRYTKQLNKFRKNPKFFHPQLLEMRQSITSNKNLVLKHWVKQKLEELIPSPSNKI